MSEQAGRPWQPTVMDDRDYAHSQMQPRAPRVPPALRPAEVAQPYALPPLPWMDRGLLGKALSPREVELLEVIRDGASNKQAAHTFGVSEQTIKNHMSSILAKLGASDRTAAVIKAASQGIVSVPIDPRSLIEFVNLAEAQLVLLRRTISATLNGLRRARSEAAAMAPGILSMSVPVRRGDPSSALLEAVGPDGIVRTGPIQRDACGKGHPFTAANTTLFKMAGRFQRACRTCARARQAARRAAA